MPIFGKQKEQTIQATMIQLSIFESKFLFLLFIFLLQGNSVFSQTEQMSQNHPVVKKTAIKQFELKIGIYDTFFPLTNKEEWAMKISIPELQPNEKVPLVIALHWAGDKETYKEFSDCLAFPALDSLNAIIIAPSSNGKHWIDPEMEARVIKLIKQVKQYWPIDEEKVLITGYSNGGIGSWEYAKKYPKLFSAAIPMACYYTPSKLKIPIYAIHGAEDELFNATEMKTVLETSIKEGSSIEYEVIPNFSHYMACAYAEVLKQNTLKMKADLWEQE